MLIVEKVCRTSVLITKIAVVVVLFTTHIVSGDFPLACLEKKLSF